MPWMRKDAGAHTTTGGLDPYWEKVLEQNALLVPRKHSRFNIIRRIVEEEPHDCLQGEAISTILITFLLS